MNKIKSFARCAFFMLFAVYFTLASLAACYAECGESDDSISKLSEFDEYNEYIVCLRDGALLFDGGTRDDRSVLESCSVVDGETLSELLKTGAVEWYEPDYEVELLEFSSKFTDELLSEKWDLEMTDAQYAWNLDCCGSGVTVGVIDSGTALHPDISNNTLQGFNYLADSYDLQDFEYLADPYDTTDTIGHGTFVNGIIAAEMNGIGIIGTAPKADIVPLKCFDKNAKTTVSTVTKAIIGAVDDYGCDVINMSLGLKQCSETLKKAVDYAIGKGCIIVASVGNDGNQTLYYPAAFDGVIGVGAVASDGTVAVFSQKNESVFVTAPGKGVLGLDVDGGYCEKKGTSFSAPAVSGLVAVLLCIDDSMSLERLKEALIASAVDCGEEGYDTSYGYGTVNVRLAIKELLSDEPIFITEVEICENDVDGGEKIEDKNKDENKDETEEENGESMPENKTESKNTVTVNVLNVTDCTFDGFFIAADYDDGVMTECEITPVEIAPNSNLLLQNVPFSSQSKRFAWCDSTDENFLAVGGYAVSADEITFEKYLDSDGNENGENLTMKLKLNEKTTATKISVCVMSENSKSIADAEAGGKLIYLGYFPTPSDGILSVPLSKAAICAAIGKESIDREMLYVRLGGNISADSTTATSVTVALPEAEYLRGDIDDDGDIDIDDAVLLFRHSMLPDTYPITYSGLLDFNADGKVDIDDAVLLFRHSMLSDLYPIG